MVAAWCEKHDFACAFGRAAADAHAWSTRLAQDNLALALAGACVDCASSTVTMRFMIKNVIMHQVPEVQDVVQEGQDDDDDDDD